MGTGQAYRWAKPLLVIASSLIVLSGMGLVFASPLALPLLDEAAEPDWRRLSEIGQTYGAISALLSAMALGGVIVSLILQSKSAKLDRLQAHRTFHVELVRMAIEDPDLLACIGSVRPGWDSLPDVEQRQSVYCNQLVSFMDMSFEVGAINESWLRGSAQELFASEVSRRWWRGRRQVFLEYPATRRPAHRILDEEWKQAMSRERVTSEVAAQESSDEPNEISKTETPTPADKDSSAADVAD